MSSEQTKNDCTREIQVEVPADIVAQETETVVQRFQKMARLPGFRRGKVPASVVRARFGEDVKSEVVDALIPRYVRQEIEKQGLMVVSQPRVTDLHMHEGEPLRFKATFEVLPHIEVSGYQEVRAEKPEITVTDDEVEQEIKAMREQQASYSPVEGRPLADGDFALVSLSGTPKEGDAKPVNVDEVMVEMGGENTVKEFTENLCGAAAGEQRTFDVAYPQDFSDQRLAGQTFSYTVAVKAIKQKHLPELNDDFARELGGEFKTMDEVRQQVRATIEAHKRHHAEHAAKEKLLDELVRRHEFSVPEALVDRQVDVRLERGLRALAAQGMRTEDMKKMDFGRLRAGQRDAAVKEVKASLILDRIADQEKIEVMDEEIAREIEALAAQTKQSAAEIRARLTREGALDRIRDRIRSDKTLEFLYRRSAS